MATITLEQAKLCYELGIKERTDGKWGYKLRCANNTCDTKTDTCYCEETVEEAINDVQSRRSQYWCSTECYQTDARFWNHEADLEDVLYDSDFDEEVFGHFGVKKGQDLPDNWRERLQSEKPELWDKIKEVYQEYLSDSWDGDKDDGECECEV